MKTRKSTKRALLLSVCAIAVCIVMLVGTTFAWFTDTATTGVNKIQSGKLDIDIVDTNGKSLQDKSLAWQKAAGHEDEQVLWEPGATYDLQSFKIVNNGNLALKYKVTINGVDGDSILLNAIDFTVKMGDEKEGTPLTEWEGILLPANSAKPDDAEANTDVETTKAITISGHMKEEAGNEYQEKEITGLGITVVATQYTYESDSYNNTYDEKATYPSIATDADTLAAAVADLKTAGDKNYTVNVANDVSGTSAIVTAAGNSLNLDFNRKTVGVNYGAGSKDTTTNGMQLLKGSTVSLRNGTYTAEHGNSAAHNIAILIQNYSNLTIENCTLSMENANDPSGNSKGTSYVISSNCGNVTIKGNTNIIARAGDYALDVMHWEIASYQEAGTHVVFDETMTGTVDGKIDVYCYRGGKVVKPVDDGGATLVIKGGTFKNSGLSLDEFKTFVPAGYNVTTNSDGSFTVSK